MSWTGITGSAAYDVEACPPRAVLGPKCKTSSSASDRGNELHDFVRKATVNPAGRAQFLEQVPEKWRHTAAGMNLAAALDGIRVKACEVAYALNVKDRTCRLIGANINRRYEETLAEQGEAPLSKYEIPFTLDIEGWSDEVDCPVELDWKSGQSVGDVLEHGQRKISAAGLIFYYGASSCISRIGYIWDSGEIIPDGAEFTEMDAWEICDEMVAMIEAVDAVKAVVARGEIPTVYPNREKQCRYCSAITVCPYWTNLIRVALNEKAPSLEEISPEKRGQVLDRVKDVLKIFEQLETDLKGHAKKEPLPIDDKYEYAVGTKAGRSYFDDSAARGMIVTLLGRLGVDEEEIAEEIKKLTKKGQSYEEVRKRKRVLPVIKSQAA